MALRVFKRKEASGIRYLLLYVLYKLIDLSNAVGERPPLSAITI